MRLFVGFVVVIALVFAFVALWPQSAAVDPTDDGGGKTTADLAQITADVFKPMDGGIELKPDEIMGRNAWNLWTAGNDQFWDRMARESYGMVDLLKTIDSHGRGSRFKTMGLINEPGFQPATKADELGLWLDERVEPEPPGVDAKVYGRSSGVMGLRIYPNPAFDEAARKRWDAKRYYEDRDYYVDPALVRPYRVGMACGFCHIAPYPLNPPADPERPKWENLASVIGNQYLREGPVFNYAMKPGSFFTEMLQTQPPGTSDTSRVATDNLNNPNAINPIFNIDARLTQVSAEDQGATAKHLPGGPVAKVPHILKDGADSVGVPGATIRVFVNIGMFHQQWLECHNKLIGLMPQRPFSAEKAHQNSVYWRATEERLANIVAFFRRIKPMRLKDAPGGDAQFTKDAAVLARGKTVFAENCATCHSSKQPPATIAANSTEAEQWYREAVAKPDFLDENFLSDERRYPVTKIKTNAARALGTNAMRGHVWDNFSSETYKNQQSVGTIEIWNPADPATAYRFQAPGGGPGFYRTPSLISLWATAPFFHNNALGVFTGDPSVAGRMKAFQDAAEKLLWPAKRLGTDSVWRTAHDTMLEIPEQVLPKFLHPLCEQGVLSLGPIPAGTPVNLLANIDPDADPAELVKLCLKTKKVFLEIKLKGLDSAAAKELMRTELVPDLLKCSKCPDLVEDRGHEFGSELPDEDKRALIEFLKTF